MREDVEKELLVEARELALGGDGEELVAEIHEDAEVSGSVIGEGDAKLAGHERRVACGGDEMIEAREGLVARGVVEEETPPDARAEGQQLGIAEALGEACVACEDDAEELLGIEVFAGEDASRARPSA